MKKLVLFAGVLVAVSFASCNSAKSEAPAAEEAVVDEVVAEAMECCGDSACCESDSCCGACSADSAACCAEATEVAE